MAIVSLAPDTRQHVVALTAVADVALVGTRNETDAPSATPRQIMPTFPIPAADSSSQDSASLSPSVSNRTAEEDIARPSNVIGDRCAARF